MDETLDTNAPDTNALTDGTQPAAGTVAHETLLGLDSYGWVAAAFLVFLLVLWRVGAFRAIGKSLDGQADKVRADLAEAAALKAEAQAMKDHAAKQAEEAEADARAMIANAEQEAQRILEQAGRDADVQIARRTRLAQDRISAAGREAEAELRSRAAEISIKAAQSVLASRTDALDGLTDTAIASLDQR